MALVYSSEMRTPSSSCSSLETTVGGNEFAAIDLGGEVDLLRVDAEAAFSEQQVGEDDAGALEAVSDVEDFSHHGEAVADVEGRADDARVVAEGGT